MEISIAAAQTAPNYACDYPPPLSDFSGEKYMGFWYEQQHVKNEYYQPDSWVCVEAQYSEI